jgi:hypothetical protein
MPEFPLIYTYHDDVAGAGFLVRVTLCGRALMVEEEPSAWWLYGVEPGALAESGDTPREAHSAFRSAFRKYVHDVAAEAPTVDALRRELERFCSDKGADTSDDERWWAAVQHLRDSADVPDPFDGLERQPAEGPCYVTVERLDDRRERHEGFSPDENQLDRIALPAAA